MSELTLVTGGSGFVGKHLAAKLRSSGACVRSFDLAAPLHDDDVQGSVTDADAVTRAMENVTDVFHLAGYAQLWARDLSLVDEVNRQGTQIVVDAAKTAGIRRFIHCSSLTTLVGEKTPIGHSTADEALRFAPGDMLGPYPRSKLLAEHIVEKAAGDGFDAMIAMPTEPLGAGDDSLTPPTQMILDFANGKTPAYIDCILNFVPVESLAEGFIAIRDKGRSGERYLLGGENLPMKKLLAMITEISGRKTPKTRLPYWIALAAGVIDTKIVAAFSGNAPKAPLTGVRLAGRQVSFSSEKARTELGWEAAPVQPALNNTLTWFESQGFLK